MSLPVVSFREMEDARKVLALGGSLQDAADQLGIERAEMDLLLWNRGGGFVGAGRVPVIEFSGVQRWISA